MRDSGAVLAQKFWGRHCPGTPQPLHHRVYFIRSPKPNNTNSIYAYIRIANIIFQIYGTVPPPFLSPPPAFPSVLTPFLFRPFPSTSVQFPLWGPPLALPLKFS